MGIRGLLCLVAVAAFAATGCNCGGSAAKLAFTGQPANTVAGEAISVQVAIVDDSGAVVKDAKPVDVTIALQSNPATGTLAGTLTARTDKGVATFGDLKIEKAGAAYTLQAKSDAVAGTPESYGFTISPAAAKQLAITAQPANGTADGVLSPVKLSVQDAFANAVTNSTVEVTAALGTNPSGATLAGNTKVHAVNGVATFNELALDKDGEGYTLAFSAAGLTAVTSNAFNVAHGSASQLALTTQPPASSVAGAPFGAVVQVLDKKGNLAKSFTGQVKVALGANAAGGTLAGTLAVNAVAGVATFADLHVDKAGAGYTLAFTSDGLTGATSNAFTVTAAAGASLAFSAQPASAVAGVALSPVAVTVLDAFGNVATSATGAISVALVANNGASLGGTLTVNAVAGVATFANLTVVKAGTGYALTASAAGNTGATSTPFDISPAAAASLLFGQQPSDAVAGVAIAPAVTVVVHDAFGNVVTGSTDSITVAAAGNAAAPVLGTTTVNAVAGVATFANLSIQKVGAYSLAATSGSLTGATSGSFNIAPAAAAQLAFSAQPSNIVAGTAISPAVAVTLLDGYGNVATSSNATVSLALSSGSLFGTTSQATVNGVAVFTDVTVHKQGTGYALTATAAGLTQAVSASFDVAAAAAASLAFSAQPSNAVAGVAIDPAVAVTAHDAFGNVATSFTGAVSLALSSNNGATLGGTDTVNAAAGVATFANLSVRKAGDGYTLLASASGLTGATSTGFNITAAAAAQLAFAQQPTDAVAGVAIAPAVTVLLEDTFGNVVTTATDSVTVALGFNAGGATVEGTLTASAVAGVATFADLSVKKAGSGYVVQATSGSLTGGTSNAFAISPAAATHLAFTVQPSNQVAGLVMNPAVEVTLLDAYENVATTSSATVSLALSSNTLVGTSSTAAVNGVAVFDAFSVQQVGTGYSLDATATGLTHAVSATFNVTHAPAAKLAFTQQPAASSTAGVTFSVTVTERDPYDNDVTDGTDSVSVALDTNPTSATLNGTTPVSAAAGIATFGDLNVQKAGSGYTLKASSGALTSGTSAAFDITPAAPASLAFGTQPSNVAAGSSISPAVTVNVLDTYGNLTTNATTSVSLALGANPGGATLQGGDAVSTSGGVATFAGLTLDKVGTGYTLSVTASGLASITSNGFDVTPGADAKLVFQVQPSNGNANTPIAAVKVAVLDAFGNQTVSTAAVTVSTASGPTGTLSGTLTQNAVAGVATFGDLVFSASGTYTLAASSGTLTGATSNSFTLVTPTLVYTDPAIVADGGSSRQDTKLALIKNPASTDKVLVLDLVAIVDLTGFAAGVNLPLDASKVVTDPAVLTPGAINPGTGVVAAAAALPTSGPLAGVFVSGVSQKAVGGGAVPTDTTFPAGTVLYTLRLDVNPSAGGGTVFDGTTMQSNPKFRMLLRDKQGNDVVSSEEVGVGTLTVQLN